MGMLTSPTSVSADHASAKILWIDALISAYVMFRADGRG